MSDKDVLVYMGLGTVFGFTIGAQITTLVFTVLTVVASR